MKLKRNKSIGIFDSGFGGLNIMKEIVKELPEYDYIYLGDTARVPYGSRSKEVVYQFTKEAVDFLFSNNCELIILACNTASSEALRKIQKEHLKNYDKNKRVLGVIIPTVEYTSLISKNKRIGVIATEGTVKSKSYINEFLKLDKKIKVFQKATPLFVPIIENGEHNAPWTNLISENYLKDLIKKDIDTLILGCTHYRILEKNIKKIVGENIKIINEGKVVAKKLRDYLKRHNEIENILSKKAKREFNSTDITEKFEKLGSRFFGKKIKVNKVVI